MVSIVRMLKCSVGKGEKYTSKMWKMVCLGSAGQKNGKKEISIVKSTEMRIMTIMCSEPSHFVNRASPN